MKYRQIRSAVLASVYVALVVGVLAAATMSVLGCSEYATVKDATTGQTVYGPAPIVRDADGTARDARTGTTLPSVNPATGNATKTTTASQLDADKVQQTGGAVVDGVAAGTPFPYGSAVKVLGGAIVALGADYVRRRLKQPAP